MESEDVTKEERKDSEGSGSDTSQELFFVLREDDDQDLRKSK